MEISKMLTISTAHVREYTLRMLACEPTSNRFQFIGVYPKSGYGYFVYINKDSFDKMKEDESVPTDLIAVVETAIKAGCDVLCLDCDGEELSELATYSD